MRHVFATMGTVASIEVDRADITDLKRMFDDLEQRFSLYRPESELSTLARGEILLAATSDTLRNAYARALDWRMVTGGLFTPHRPDGTIDLNGTIKAEAIDTAGAMLDDDGCREWAINVGGDILVRAAPGHTVTPIGITDPRNLSALLCAISPGRPRRAIATSGSAERGDHIWLGGEIRPAELLQVTVIANDIVTADVLATAIVAGGRDALDDIADRWDVDVLTVDRSGELLATPGCRTAMGEVALS